MMARSHVVVGLAAWVSAASWLHAPAYDTLHLGAAVFGALLPDVDHPGSWVGRRTRPLSTLAAGALGHRGVTHSALAVAGLVFVLEHWSVRGGIAAAVAIGYLSHLAADLLTPQGLRLAWPLRRRWSLPLCRTGSPAEPLIVFVLLFATAWRMAAHVRL